MRSVAIVGEFCSGKSTLARELVEKYDYTAISFAGRLKQLAADIYASGYPIRKDFTYLVTDEFGNEDAISGRALLQRLGQAVKALDRDLWVRWLMSDIETGRLGEGPFVTDDCRFPYEADSLRRTGFAIVRLSTPEPVRMQRYENVYGRLPTAAELGHPSETEVRNIRHDAVYDGTDTIPDLLKGLLPILL